jgi:hypothetical protein
MVVRAGFARVLVANQSLWEQTCPDGYFLGQKSPRLKKVTGGIGDVCFLYKMNYQ